MVDRQQGWLKNDRFGRMLPFSNGILNARKVPKFAAQAGQSESRISMVEQVWRTQLQN